MSFFGRLSSRFRKVCVVAASSTSVCATAAFVQSNLSQSEYTTSKITNKSESAFLKEYTLSDVHKHNSDADRLWVSFRDGVYDVTDFVKKHSGGPEYIELVAGGRLEPFWDIFPHHLSPRANVMPMLSEFRIGNLAKQDQLDRDYDAPYVDGPIQYLNEFSEFYHEPERPYDKLTVMQQVPFLAEANIELLGDSYITPSELFYVRNHFPVPYEINKSNYKLELHLNHNNEVGFGQMNDEWEDLTCDTSLTLQQIKNDFENVELTATLQCSGNRGEFGRKENKLTGTTCLNGFISNATWKGVRISDVLEKYGYDKSDERFSKYKYVTFYGYDTDLSTLHYAMSVPIEWIMNESNDCLLAFEMNGEDLPRDHGYPLRVLLPGTAGCRSVKWLAKIQLTEGQVDNYWQSKAYQPFKHLVYDMPVMSVISRPTDNMKLSEMMSDDNSDNTIGIQGFAWSGGGRGIIKVEVSIDGGKSWSSCELIQETNQERRKQWAWTLWKANLTINSGSKKDLKIMCRALDSSFNSQPSTVDHIVNNTMYVNNSWHSIDVINDLP